MRHPLGRVLIFELVETSRLLRTYADQRSKEHGATRAQWGVLGRLRRKDGLTQADLAELLQIQPISLGRLIDRLSKLGYVERRGDPKDRRVRRLYLTHSGSALVDNLDPLADAIASEVLAGLPRPSIAGALETLLRLRATLASLASKRRDKGTNSTRRVSAKSDVKLHQRKRTTLNQHF